MEFESLDEYLLSGKPDKAAVVRQLLAERPGGARASAFYEGLALLGARAPELSLIALRLVLAGKAAEDAAVVRLREIVERARGGDATAVEAYRRELLD